MNLHLSYSVSVKDKEDANIDPKRIQVKLDYIPKDAGSFKNVNGKGVLVMPGKTLIETNDCKACHTIDQTVVGPAFTAIAERYQNNAGEIPRLAAKIITGGAGHWGNHYMNAHPQISKEDATTLVKYILSLMQQKTYDSLPATGSASIKPPAGATGGSWALTASYTDFGNNVVPLTASKQLVLRQPVIASNDADMISGIRRHNNMLGALKNKAYFVIRGIDLKQIKKVTYNYAAKDNETTLEVHIDSLNGAVISSLDCHPTGDWNKFRELTTPVTENGGLHDPLFCF
jgi:cytochrome c